MSEALNSLHKIEADQQFNNTSESGLETWRGYQPGYPHVLWVTPSAFRLTLSLHDFTALGQREYDFGIRLNGEAAAVTIPANTATL